MYFSDFMKQVHEDENDKKNFRKSMALKNKKINHLLFDRNKIIQQLLKVVETKLNNYGEKSLANGISW